MGRISRHLNLESSDAKVRKDSENTMQTELNYATHLGKLIKIFNMIGKYQTGKIHKWVLEIQKTYLAKNVGNMGRTSDPMGQTR